MNETTFKPGQEVWSVSRQERVTIHILGTKSAYCLDENREGYLLPLSDLSPLDWDMDTIMRREG